MSVHPTVLEAEVRGEYFKTAMGACLGCFRYRPIVIREAEGLRCELCGADKVIDLTLLPIADGAGIWNCFAAVERGEAPHQFDPFSWEPPVRSRHWWRDIWRKLLRLPQKRTTPTTLRS